MNRREFLAAAAAGGLVATRIPAATPFPLHYARKSPYDELLQYVEPGRDEFEGEKTALDLEARLARQFPGTRTYALPDSKVRFETAAPNRYETGTWQLPDLSVVSRDSIESARPYFRDVTAHVFGATPSFQQQLLKGNPYWRTHLDAATGIDTDGNQGIAVGDIDNDGVDEIYVCQPGGLPNRLYKLRADGTAEDITERAGWACSTKPPARCSSISATPGIRIWSSCARSGPLLFLNQGDGTFREQPDAFRFKPRRRGLHRHGGGGLRPRWPRRSLSLHLRLFPERRSVSVSRRLITMRATGRRISSFDNRLTPMGGVFEDVTGESGMNENNDRFSFAPAWCDFDGDGWPDLYVANDFGRNNLYRNRSGQFHGRSGAGGVEDIGAGDERFLVRLRWRRPSGSVCLKHVDRCRAARRARSRVSPAHGKSGGISPAHKGKFALPQSRRRNVRRDRRRRRTLRWAAGHGVPAASISIRTASPEIFIASGMVTNGSLRQPDLESFFWRQVVANSRCHGAAVPEYENGWNTHEQLFREDYDWRGHEPNVFYVRRDGRYRGCFRHQRSRFRR